MKDIYEKSPDYPVKQVRLAIQLGIENGKGERNQNEKLKSKSALNKIYEFDFMRFLILIGFCPSLLIAFKLRYFYKKKFS